MSIAPAARHSPLVRPHDVAGVQAAVRAVCRGGRGDGPARWRGKLHRWLFGPQNGGHVVFDLGALDGIVVNETNLTVTVGAGATWAALKDALDAKGLRTPFWGAVLRPCRHCRWQHQPKHVEPWQQRAWHLRAIGAWGWR